MRRKLTLRLSLEKKRDASVLIGIIKLKELCVRRKLTLRLSLEKKRDASVLIGIIKQAMTSSP